ncbi:MAG: hypothetical protein JRI23_16590 [Deltaproteobacteria bacterium]|jgi:hypothetical protein|nr:hypothetical protein [Deltaproteobacteria bacterium]MBW2533395.1 hypothetical protein [Deltaproteobacteria bacterium]
MSDSFGSNAKNKILARRARFVAAALAGVGLTSATACRDPQPCLSIEAVPPTSAPTVDVPAEDAAGQTTTEAGTAEPEGTGAGDAGATPEVPKPCLSIAPADEPAPRPCLSRARPCLSPPAPPPPPKK